MEDLCLRGVSEDGSVKLWLAQTTNLCEEGRRRHDAWSVGAAALGRLLTAGVFFGLNLKGEGDSVTLRVNGDGPLGSIETKDGHRLNLYNLIPAYKEEIEYKLKYGMEALEEIFKEKLPMILDPKRPNLCEDFKEVFDD